MRSRNVFLALGLAAGLTACNGGGETPGQKLDTLLKKADTVAEKIDTVAGKAWDSTKAKVKQLDNKISDALRKDTTKR